MRPRFELLGDPTELEATNVHVLFEYQVCELATGEVRRIKLKFTLDKGAEARVDVDCADDLEQNMADWLTDQNEILAELAEALAYARDALRSMN